MQNLHPEKNNEIVSTLISNDNLYIFNNGENLTNLNNNPNLLNLRNDYSIWGEKTTPSGVVVPIHLRYAIDKKPTKYVTIEVEDGENSKVSNYAKKHNIIVTGQYSIEYIAGSEWKSEYKEITVTKSTYEKNMYYYKKGDNYILDDEGYKEGRKYYIVYRRTCDWREVLYRMAADYYKYNFLDDFNARIGEKNAELYPLGITGYENYYIDIYSFWRDLYNPLVDEEKHLKNFLKEAKE